MKRQFTAASLALSFLSISTFAAADCGGAGYTDSTNVSNFLSGKTVCVGSAPNFDAQEFHHPSGSLLDYKHGPTDKSDPTAIVGTWQATQSNVTHRYGASAYIYTVGVNSSTGMVAFCSLSGGQTIYARYITGQSAC